ncbi:hypothetical protein JW930_01170 [Candidatus Woesearchaeota archaeon]|nr:hypothetical protein [Candidatus Woesearchaeota archaeon]
MIKLLLYLVVLVVIFIVIFKIVRQLLKTLIFFAVIITIIALVCGYFVAKDVNDLRKNLYSQQSLFLLLDDNTIITGFEAQDFEPAAILSEESISDIQQLYDENDLNEILGTRYKLFIFKQQDFSFNESIPEEFSTLVTEGGLLLVLKEYKNDNLKVFPETAFFRLIKIFYISAQRAKRLIEK